MIAGPGLKRVTINPVRARVDGEDVPVSRTEDGYRATQRICPRQHSNSADGRNPDNGAILRSTLHGYTFKFADGKGISCPDFRIRVYDVVRDGGRLLIAFRLDGHPLDTAVDFTARAL